ncbi:hypothetical protein [Microcoleus sp. S13_B4]|uniref:hypothetical protein n=1 Tax=Microcoleus sp. S13_B4 TaxID=3055408 RepID=UPI002FD2FD46
MFEYKINILFDIESKDENIKFDSIFIAKFKFDLGLQLDEIVELKDIPIGDKNYDGDEPMSFTAMVKRKEKTIQVDKNDNSVFIIDIFLEIADREKHEEIRNIIRRLHPDRF